MAIYDLNPAALPVTNVNVTEDVRGPATPTAPVTVGTTPSTIAAANSQRATLQIFNGGTSSILLGEGTTVSATIYNHPLPPGRLWEPDPSFRYFGAISAISPSGANTQIRVSESIIL